MSQAYTLTVEEPGRIGRQDLPAQDLAPNEVRIETLYSGISAGTEMSAFRGTSPYLSKHWNPELRLFERGDSSMSFPMPAIGYEEVGQIVEVGKGVTRLRSGQIIWGNWGHRSEKIATEDWASERVLAEGVSPRLGIFAQIGAIALNAVIDANIHVGEYVAVFGQGVPGQLVAQLAKANGGTVIAVDRMAQRLEVASAAGAHHTIDASSADPADVIKALTGGRGADVSIEMSGAYPALHEAIRATAYNSRVVVSGFFQGEGKGLLLGEEFHHNRIELVCSQIFGVSPSVDHRWDRLRLDQTFMALVADGRVTPDRIISHVVPAAEAQSAFELLTERPEEALQVVLDFTGGA